MENKVQEGLVDRLCRGDKQDQAAAVILHGGKAKFLVDRLWFYLERLVDLRRGEGYLQLVLVFCGNAVDGHFHQQFLANGRVENGHSYPQGKPIRSGKEGLFEVASLQPGTTIQIELKRDNQTLLLPTIVGIRPATEKP